MAPRQRKKRANLRDVARKAEVSVATVSRVLNSPEIVQQETRERVEAAIAELNFVPSAAARAINSGRSKIVGALVPTLDSDIFAQTIDVMENRLGDFGISLVVATTNDDRHIEARKAQELLDIGVEGLFLSGITHNDALHALIERTRVPTIAMSYFDQDYHLPTIGYDNFEAGRIALEHLLELGHQSIAVVHGPSHDNDRTRQRLAGISSLGDKLALKFFETELDVRGGCRATIMSLEEDETFDAYLCVTDVLAYGVIFELQRQGLSVPSDASVMGLHDLPSSQMTNPRLSTVRLPVPEMGNGAAEALANWIENDERPSSVCYPSKLVARESTLDRSSGAD